MTREELREHCERQIQQFERVEKIMPVTPNDWKRYEEHKLILELLEQTRWIPVSERLPEEDGYYLVTTTGTNNDIIDIAYYTDGIWHKASRIKSWQPLPQPYKAESEE